MTSRPPAHRAAQRAAVVCGGTTLLMLAAASPVFATAHRDDGDDPGKPLTKMDALLIYGGVPLACLLTIWIMCSITTMFKNKRR